MTNRLWPALPARARLTAAESRREQLAIMREDLKRAEASLETAKNPARAAEAAARNARDLASDLKRRAAAAGYERLAGRCEAVIRSAGDLLDWPARFRRRRRP